ncbi:MAG: cytotoxic translational repressor of toxin-antitoxin stability system [Proteobacteria bacterium]|nr:cytotoxic translational repressor of toxin-antitoxin stability system [Pseudomonadota bacterium]
MMRISASEQVQAWLLGLPPQTKRRVRLALRGLARGRGDIKGLIGPLAGYNRLRIGGLRIIYRQVQVQEIHLEYANNRDVIYELYQDILASGSV